MAVKAALTFDRGQAITRAEDPQQLQNNFSRNEGRRMTEAEYYRYSKMPVRIWKDIFLLTSGKHSGHYVEKISSLQYLSY